MVLPADAKGAFDNLDIFSRESGVDVATHHGRFPGNVAAARTTFR